MAVSLIIASFNNSTEDKIGFSFSKIEMQSFDSTIKYKGRLEINIKVVWKI
jgi:hypothetical protein